VVGPDREPDALKELLRNLGQGKSRKLATAGPVQEVLGSFQRQMETLCSLNDPRGVYARMPFDINLK
jgi:hypothetical protein